MNFKRFSAAVCALAVSAALLASCGDSDSSSTAAADSKEEATTTTTTAAQEETTTTTTTTAETETTTTTEAAPAPAADFEYQTKFEGYDAFLMFGDGGWQWGNWNGTGEETEGFGIDADITGDGEYTVSITKESIIGPDDRINPNMVNVDENLIPDPAAGAMVFCVDIMGICDGTTNAKGDAIESNKLKDAEDGKNYPNIDPNLKGKFKGDSSDVKVEVVSIKQDGEELAFDKDKIVYGNIEDNNNRFRIEIYNEYGATKEDAPIDSSAISFQDSLEVTFKIEGLGEVGPFDTPAWAE